MKPASPKQFAFIKSLLAERTLNEHEQAFVQKARDKAVEGNLSSSGASNLIEWLLAIEPSSGPQEASLDPEPGVYVLDGDLYHVKVGKQSSKAYAQRWSTEAQTWEYEGRKVLSRLTGRITAKEAADFGHAYGICVFCSRELTDPRSVHMGYGPVCADYHSLPWGENPEVQQEPGQGQTSSEVSLL